METIVVDPVAEGEDIVHEYGIQVADYAYVKDVDAAIFAVAHKEFLDLSSEYIDSIFSGDTKVIMDVKGIVNKDKIIRKRHIVLETIIVQAIIGMMKL